VKRLSAFCRIRVTELGEAPLPANPSQAQIDQALRKEAADILSRLPRASKLVALCVEGSLLSSEALAGTLSQWMTAGTSAVTLVIGGSFGLHPSVKEAADLCLSMSPMTFPHHLARIMVLEQLYRAFQIREGARYHK
jgi:23S rRNA (pseudouridine1915-N3)-methyltransferase